MNSELNTAVPLETMIHELIDDAEALLVLAAALEGEGSALPTNLRAKKRREIAALVKSAALRITLVAANMVRAAERLRTAAEFRQND